MINIEKRKDLVRFDDYFADDFGSPAWDALGSEPGRAARISRAVVPDDLSSLSWGPLPKRNYLSWMKGLPAHAAPGNVLAVELIFSPPKTYSVAALAGKQVRPELLEVQDQAVGLVALEIIRNSWVRQTEHKTLNLVSAISEVWRFSHPFNRAGEPQFHDHLVVLARIIRRGNRTSSLDARPYYALKSAFEALYHHALRGGLTSRGFEVVATGSGHKCWQLAGIDPTISKDFSSRSRSTVVVPPGMTRGEFAQLRRLEMLSERVLFPKLPDASLADARIKWTDIIGSRQAEPRRCPPEPSPTEPLVVRDLFDDAVILTQTELLARLAKKVLWERYSVAKLEEYLTEYLREACGTGEVVNANGVYCHLGHLDIYKQVWTEVRAGLGQGIPAVLKVSERGSKWRDLERLKAAIASPDLIRIVPVKDFPELVNSSEFLSVSDFEVTGGQLVWEPKPTPVRLLGHIARRAANEKLVIVVPWQNESRKFISHLLRIGNVPAGATLAARRVVKWGQASFEVRKGTIEPGSKSLLAAVGQAPPGATSVLAPASLSSEAFAKLTSELLLQQWRRLGKPEAHRVLTDEIIPWSEAGGELNDVCLVALHHLPGVARHSQRRQVFSGSAGLVVLWGGRIPKEVPLAVLLGYSRDALLVRERRYYMPVGASCVATANFRRKPGKLKKGRIVIPKEVEADGSVTMVDGSCFAPGFRLFTPSVLVRELPTQGVSQIVAEAEDSLIYKLVEAKVRGKVILLARNPAEAKGQLAGTILSLRQKKKKEAKPEPLVPKGKGIYSPPMSFWWERLAIWKERIRVRLAVKQQAEGTKDNPQENDEVGDQVKDRAAAHRIPHAPVGENQGVPRAGSATSSAGGGKPVRRKRTVLPPSSSLPGNMG
ncbi:hypothetical protein BH09VER1_BH09VER1_17740 [soil metagenome]